LDGLEAALVVANGEDLAGIPFFKMTGSGNDFVFLDGRVERHRALETPETVARICGRGTGVGADGVVWLMPADGPNAFRMRYRNSDGSIADMCGNASLCSVALSTRLGIAPADRPFQFLTDAGTLTGRVRPDGAPEVTLTPISGLAPEGPPKPRTGERIGFADTGVPHVVVLVDDAEAVDLTGRGRELRHDPSLGPAGANVDFVSPKAADIWRMRTFERGVEGETLACGTGAVATAALLKAWGLTGSETTIETTSGRTVLVSIRESDRISTPSLAGEGRLVYEGRLQNL
jgi:diaminopimelate epimerase